MELSQTYSPWIQKRYFIIVFYPILGIWFYLFGVHSLEVDGVGFYSISSISLASVLIGGAIYRFIKELENEGIVVDDEGIEIKVSAESKLWGKIKWEEIDGLLIPSHKSNMYTNFMGLTVIESCHSYDKLRSHNKLPLKMLGFSTAFLNTSYDKLTERIIRKARLSRTGYVSFGGILYKRI